MSKHVITHRSQPHKWLKYDVLAAFGLADINYLRKTIRRFPWSERSHAIECLREAMALNDGNVGKEGSRFYVVKFVPHKLAMLLPNYRIMRLGDLAAVERAFDSVGASRYEELWFCTTDVSQGNYSVAGRILIDPNAGKDLHSIEQVWRCSPRLIESLGPEFPYPFVRAYRSGWGWSPRIEAIHMPSLAQESESRLLDEFATALRLLDKKREKLELFSEALIQVCRGACSLEYKIEGGNVQIIDWDSTNDSAVV